MEDVGERSLRRSPVQSYLILSLGDPGKAFRKNVQKIYRFYLGRWNSFSSIFRQAWLPQCGGFGLKNYLTRMQFFAITWQILNASFKLRSKLRES